MPAAGPCAWTARSTCRRSGPTTRRAAGGGGARTVTFATKPELARRMLERAFAAGVPAAWVTGDSVYGGDRRLRVWLEEQDRPSCWPSRAPNRSGAVLDWPLGRATRRVIAGAYPGSDGSGSRRAGAKGPRWYDWARVRLARLQLTAGERRWEHWLLVRRSLSNPTDWPTMSCSRRHRAQHAGAVAGQRWRIEQSFELAKGEVGLDQYEVRRWEGWYAYDAGDVRLGLSHGLRARVQTRLTPRPCRSRCPASGDRDRGHKKGAIKAAGRLEQRTCSR